MNHYIYKPLKCAISLPFNRIEWPAYKYWKSEEVHFINGRTARRQDPFHLLRAAKRIILLRLLARDIGESVSWSWNSFLDARRYSGASPSRWFLMDFTYMHPMNGFIVITIIDIMYNGLPSGPLRLYSSKCKVDSCSRHYLIKFRILPYVGLAFIAKVGSFIGGDRDVVVSPR